MHTVSVSDAARALYCQPPSLTQQLWATCLSRTVSFGIAGEGSWTLDLLASGGWDESSSSGGTTSDIAGVVFGTLLGLRTVASSLGGSLDGDAVRWVSEVGDRIWISHTSWRRGPRQW